MVLFFGYAFGLSKMRWLRKKSHCNGTALLLWSFSLSFRIFLPAFVSFSLFVSILCWCKFTANLEAYGSKASYLWYENRCCISLEIMNNLLFCWVFYASIVETYLNCMPLSSRSVLYHICMARVLLFSWVGFACLPSIRSYDSMQEMDSNTEAFISMTLDMFILNYS